VELLRDIGLSQGLGNNLTGCISVKQNQQKFQIFWDVTPCGLVIDTDVSRDHSALISNAKHFKCWIFSHKAVRRRTSSAPSFSFFIVIFLSHTASTQIWWNPLIIALSFINANKKHFVVKWRENHYLCLFRLDSNRYYSQIIQKILIISTKPEKCNKWKWNIWKGHLHKFPIYSVRLHQFQCLAVFISDFLSFILNYSDLLLHSHCRCRGLLLHLITLNDTHTQTHTHTHTVGLLWARDRSDAQTST